MIDGQSYAPAECWAGPCGEDTPECDQPEGVDGGAAMSFDLGGQRIIAYPPVDGQGDVFWDGGCAEWKTVEGPLGTTETCVSWDHVLFTDCWVGDYTSQQDGPGSSYRLVDAMIECELEGRTLAGSLRCERGAGALAKENGL